jgi:hypothetical protein
MEEQKESKLPTVKKKNKVVEFAQSNFRNYCKTTVVIRQQGR